MSAAAVVAPPYTFPLFSRLIVNKTPLRSLLLPFCHSSLTPSPRRSLSMASAAQSPAQAVASGDVNSDGSVLQLIQTHQEKATRLPPLEEIRTVLDRSTRGVLSTFSQKYDGYPSGSMVDFACDAVGFPILAVSSLAVHTKIRVLLTAVDIFTSSVIVSDAGAVVPAVIGADDSASDHRAVDKEDTASTTGVATSPIVGIGVVDKATAAFSVAASTVAVAVEADSGDNATNDSVVNASTVVPCAAVNALAPVIIFAATACCAHNHSPWS